LDYPFVSHDRLMTLYRTAAVAALVGSWGCILWGIFRSSDLAPGISHLVLILYAATDVVLNLVPYARGFGADWPLVQIANLLLLAACIVAHVLWLARQRPVGQAAR